MVDVELEKGFQGVNYGTIENNTSINTNDQQPLENNDFGKDKTSMPECVDAGYMDMGSFPPVDDKFLKEVLEAEFFEYSITEKN